MCGISGVFSFAKPTNPNRSKMINFLEQAMYVGSVRGRDGTGIFGVMRANNQIVRHARRAVDGSMFGDSYAAQSILVDAEDYMATVVHNRKGTMGGNNDDSTHPFQIGKITLVHNGTLHTHRQLGGGNNHTSDSAAIAYALSRTDDPKSVLEELSGAFTLIWYDSETENLHIARNDKRPLNIAFHTASDLMVFCSEKGMLEWLCGRAGTDIKIGDVFQPAEDTLYSWDISKAGATVKSYTEEKFTGIDDWEDYNNYGDACNIGAANITRGYDRPANHSAGANYSRGTSAQEHQVKATSERKKREESLEKFGVEIGDTVEFVAYDVSAVNPVSNMVRVEGLDVAGAFEVVCHIHWTAEAAIMYGKLEGARCKAIINTVVKTPQYETWPIISVTAIRVEEENFWKEGKDYAKSPVTNATVINLPDTSKEVVAKAADKSDYVPPSKFCTCSAETRVKCISICNCCEGQEIEETAREAECGGYVQQDSESLPANGYSGMAPDTLVPCGYGIRRTLSHWEEETKHGCSNCTTDLLDPNTTYWTRNNDPLCYDCIEEYAELGVFIHKSQAH